LAHSEAAGGEKREWGEMQKTLRKNEANSENTDRRGGKTGLEMSQIFGGNQNKSNHPPNSQAVPNNRAPGSVTKYLTIFSKTREQISALLSMFERNTGLYFLNAFHPDFKLHTKGMSIGGVPKLYKTLSKIGPIENKKRNERNKGIFMWGNIKRSSA